MKIRGVFVILLMCVFMRYSFAKTEESNKPSDKKSKNETKKTKEKKYAAIKHVPLNVRNGPSKEYPVILIVKKKNTQVEVLYEIDNFCLLRFKDQEEGWTICAAVSRNGKLTQIKKDTGLYRIPEKQKIKNLEKDEYVEIIEQNSTWTRVEVDAKTTGWVKTSDVNKI